MELSKSLERLHQLYHEVVYTKKLSPMDDLIDSFEFAQCWEAAKQFRLHSLLTLAKFTYTKIEENKEIIGGMPNNSIYDDVCQNLINFTFRFLTTRQIAYTFDLLATIVDSKEFEDELMKKAGESPFYNERAFIAMQLGVSGLALRDVDRLIVKAPKVIDIKPLFSIDESIASLIDSNDLLNVINIIDNNSLQKTENEEGGATVDEGNEEKNQDEQSKSEENIDLHNKELSDLLRQIEERIDKGEAGDKNGK